VTAAAQRTGLPLTFLGLLFMYGGAVQAQAWLPERGSFSVATAFSDNLNKKHYLPNGTEVDVGHTRTKVVAVSATYALTDRWMIEAGVPYVEARYAAKPGTDLFIDAAQSYSLSLHALLHRLYERESIHRKINLSP
jgi:hypothetical protein